MGNIIGNMIKNSMDLNDETIASSMLSSTKEAIDIYLNATLTSSTPELRSIYSASLGQMVAGHTALTELSVHKGWINPYNAPTQQLSDSYNESKNVINETK
ncbi:MAG TPA: spore coat protein [Clostridium sp.]